MLQIAVKSEIAKVMTAISPSSRDAKLMMQAELAAHKDVAGEQHCPLPVCIRRLNSEQLAWFLKP